MATFIDSMLERLLVTSLQSALLVGALWLLCRRWPRLSPATQCWLWWLVALQVLLGLCMEPVRLPWLPQAPAAVPVESVMPWVPLPAVAAAAAVVPSFTTRMLAYWPAGVLLLWVAGMVLMGRATLREWWRTRRLLRESTQCTDAQLLRIVGQAAAARGLRDTPRLRISGDIHSPMVVGHFAPVLMLPAPTSLSGAELEMAVAHELEHLRRADLWLGLIPTLARHCFFFHPLVHLAEREYDIAREAACDAAVVDAGDRSRRDYGDLLVRLGTTESTAGLAAASPTFVALSRRLALLQHTRFLPRAGSMAVLLLALVAALPLRLVAAVTKSAVVPVDAASMKVAQQIAATVEPVVPPGPAPGNVQRTQPKAGAVRVATPAAPVVVPPPPGSSARRSESVITKPAYRFKPDIQDYYPPVSRSAGEQGVVKVRLCYDGNGMVTEATVPESSGFPRLDEAAGRYASLVRMMPGTVDGVPQADCVVMPVRFSLGAGKADGAPATQYTGERMSANFQDIPTRTLLQLIGDVSGRNLVVDQSVGGTISMSINNVPWDQALDIVLRAKGLEKRVEGDVIVISAAVPVVTIQPTRIPAQ